LVLPEKEALEHFDRIRETGGWCGTTTAQYWATICAAAKTLSLPLPPSFAQRRKIYEHLAKEENDKRPTVPMTNSDMVAIGCALRQDHRLELQVSFFLGQRIGDVLQVRVEGLRQIDDTPSKTGLLSIAFRKGKTVRRRDPFSLHIPSDQPLAQELLQVAATKSAKDYLFVADESRETAMSAIRSAIKKHDPTLSLLLIRRGGLQALADEGASLSTLLHHSRHTTEMMLNRYLNWGERNLLAARERLGLTSLGNTQGTQK
jgi:hypothetical protein